jgi:hypothetical protein
MGDSQVVDPAVVGEFMQTLLGCLGLSFVEVEK